MSADVNPRLYGLITEFYNLTDCPVLVNTSFNVRGEPIVGSPQDALECFMATGIDYLVIENFLIGKPQLNWKSRKITFIPD